MISKHDALIGYVSFGDEPDPYKIFQLKSLTKLSVVPKDSHTDPFVMADMFTKIYDNKNVCVLVPGTRFDIFGNRKGRGGGHLILADNVQFHLGGHQVGHDERQISEQPRQAIVGGIQRLVRNHLVGLDRDALETKLLGKETLLRRI